MCGFNVIKTKHEITKSQRRKRNIINRLKYAVHKNFSVCIDVYKVVEGNNYNKIYKVLWTIKNKKLKINNTLIGKYKDLFEKPDFEQKYYSRTTEGIYTIGHDSIRLMKWLAHYDRSHYENKNYYDLMGSILKCLNEIS